MGNNVVSIPAIAALLGSSGRDPTCAASRGRLVEQPAAAGGCVCGAATGFTTAALDLVAVGVAVLLLGATRRPFRRSRWPLARCACREPLGFLATDGVWALRLCRDSATRSFPWRTGSFALRTSSPSTRAATVLRPRSRGTYLRPPLDIALGRHGSVPGDPRATAATCCSRSGADGCARRPRAWPASARWSALFDARDGQRRARVLARGLPRVGDGVLLLPLHDDARDRSPRLRSWSWCERSCRSVLVVPAVLALPGSRVVTDRTPGDVAPGRTTLAGASAGAALVLMAGGPISFAIPAFPASDRSRPPHLDSRERRQRALRPHGRRSDRAHRGRCCCCRLSASTRGRTRRRGCRAGIYDPEQDVGPAAARFGLGFANRCEDMRTRAARFTCARWRSWVRPRPSA